MSGCDICHSKSVTRGLGCEQMTQSPKVCPVCGVGETTPMLRSPITQIEAERQIISGVMAYRCRHGHVFLVSECASKANHAG